VAWIRRWRIGATRHLKHVEGCDGIAAAGLLADSLLQVLGEEGVAQSGRRHHPIHRTASE
jgi:hypothetical protein